MGEGPRLHLDISLFPGGFLEADAALPEAVGGVGLGHRLQEGPGVGVLGVGDDLGGGARLHNFPPVHYGDAGGELAGGAVR